MKSQNPKIVAALEAMQELLVLQTANGLTPKRSALEQIEPFDRKATCALHIDCQIKKYEIWRTISQQYPSCRSRRYVNESGLAYYVVLSAVSELSPRLGLGETECIAWENALAIYPD